MCCSFGKNIHSQIVHINTYTKHINEYCIIFENKFLILGIEDDEDLEEADVKQAIESIKKQGGAILTAKQKKAKIQAYNR